MTQNENNPKQHAIQVLVAAKIDKPLTYLFRGDNPPKVGSLVQVPLARRRVTGIISGSASSIDDNNIELKPIFHLLSQETAVSEEIVSLIQWCQRYYHTPIGQVVAAALPKSILKGAPTEARSPGKWQPSDTAPEESSITAKQQAALNWIKEHAPCSSTAIITAGYGRHLINTLKAKQLIEPANGSSLAPNSKLVSEPLPELTQDQKSALNKIAGQPDSRKPGFYLLDGVTGSGKTEVYLRAAQAQLGRNQQVLMLVPEIGLIEQSLERLKRRFSCDIFNYHSDTPESEKIRCWKQVRLGTPLIVVGTRSSIFLPFSRLSLIIVDEEHDLSYKQQEGFRYNARDLAVIRANHCQADLILGSATPSLESINNVQRGQFSLLKLSERIGNRPLPQWHFSPTVTRQELSPISNQTISAIRDQLNAGQQVLVFINRRGFAPLLQCSHCGWQAKCLACETAMTLHKLPSGLICHRCDQRTSVPQRCPVCKSAKLQSIGMGTEQLESFLSQAFPDIQCLRIDRDSTQRKGSFAEKISQLHENVPAILIGTQMITKGHHLPGISLVVVLEADTALLSHDYRSLEQLAQSLVQVAGRAGRGNTAGNVLIETSQPQHPVFSSLSSDSYQAFAAQLLETRSQQRLPPFLFSALIHANCEDLKLLQHFMLACQQHLHSDKQTNNLEIVGPMPSPIEKRNNRFRYQIQLYAASRSILHRCLYSLEHRLSALKGFGKIRLAIDIDPLTLD